MKNWRQIVKLTILIPEEPSEANSCYYPEGDFLKRFNHN